MEKNPLLYYSAGTQSWVTSLPCQREERGGLRGALRVQLLLGLEGVLLALQSPARVVVRAIDYYGSLREGRSFRIGWSICAITAWREPWLAWSLACCLFRTGICRRSQWGVRWQWSWPCRRYNTILVYGVLCVSPAVVSRCYFRKIDPYRGWLWIQGATPIIIPLSAR